MKSFLQIVFFVFCAGVMHSFSFAQKKITTDAIYSGVPWFDDSGEVVSAHGANIIQDNYTYYLFGERHTDTSNAFVGFNCYSSTDLRNWKFESIALPLQSSGKLGPNRVGERPKVMKCPATGEYIMYMHVDTLGYTDQFVGYATSKNITGPYTFRGPLLFNGKPIKKWDMGTFQDKDGSGYVLLHGGDIYKLNDDYTGIDEQVCKAFERGFEAPTLFRKDSIYYFMGSDLSGWERNDNYYFTATSLKGPWTKRGLVAPQGTLTWNSQTSFVLPIHGLKGEVYMFMGDRWSFPKQASAATYIWLPIIFSGYSISIPKFSEGWRVSPFVGSLYPVKPVKKSIGKNDPRISYSGQWRQDTLAVKTSGEKDASFSFSVKATQIGIYALARPDGGYAHVAVTDSKGKTILSCNIDMYCKYPVSTLKFITPILPKDNYKITVTVLAENWYWVEKSGRRSGSKGYYVSLDKIVFK